MTKPHQGADLDEAGWADDWVAEIVALYAALRMFGVHLSPARVVLAYGTGYVVTRRSLPLAGAAPVRVSKKARVTRPSGTGSPKTATARSNAVVRASRGSTA